MEAGEAVRDNAVSHCCEVVSSRALRVQQTSVAKIQAGRTTESMKDAITRAVDLDIHAKAPADDHVEIAKRMCAGHQSTRVECCATARIVQVFSCRPSPGEHDQGCVGFSRKREFHMTSQHDHVDPQRDQQQACHHVTLDMMTHRWVPVNTHSTPVSVRGKALGGSLAKATYTATQDHCALQHGTQTSTEHQTRVATTTW